MSENMADHERHFIDAKMAQMEKENLSNDELADRLVKHGWNANKDEAGMVLEKHSRNHVIRVIATLEWASEILRSRAWTTKELIPGRWSSAS